jgi:hypothetical protein
MNRKPKLNRKEPRYVSVLSVHVPDVMGLIDMLRYDQCCPLNEDESRKIWNLLGETRGGADASSADHCIRLLRFAANSSAATEGRWRSFGCRVLDERAPGDEPISDEDLLRLAAK